MFEMPKCRFAFNSKALVLMGAVVGWLVIANGAISPGSPVSPKDGLLLSVVPTGSVIPYAGEQIPPGWLECNGQVVKTADYPELAECLKGGPFWDGKSRNFTVPNLHGRFPLGVGKVDGSTDRAIGETGGEETHKLSISELPAHSHIIDGRNIANARKERGGFENGMRQVVLLDNTKLDKPNRVGGGISETEDTGEKVAHGHNNMPPFLVLRYLIKY